MFGILYLLSVDIGNVNDLTLKALHALNSGEYFVVEDTRVFAELLKRVSTTSSPLTFSHESIRKKIISFHDYSEKMKIDKIISLLKEGNDIYLVSDAGSPIISDPAYPLIEQALKNDIQLKSIPGVSSLIIGLELSGLPPYPFHFFGFFPRENSKQEKIIKILERTSGTSIFFESPKRLIETVDLLVTKLFSKSRSNNSTRFAICRELTKKFESVYRFNINEWSEIKESIILKGEFCILLNIDEETANLGKTNQTDQELVILAEEIIKVGAKKKLLAKLLGQILDKNSKEIYQKLNIVSK
ncbi:MAG: 16S rRNA (cytidine(1402)-2'-O)-methyltransferase [Oligoflexia bacterium]|nr:16S rRNA (cytidine(1402)-2'-O)-methyltransferase [Oligoflexia bacterium]